MCEAGDEKAGPVDAAAVMPAGSRFGEEGLVEAGSYCGIGIEGGFVEMCVVLLVERAEEVIDQAGRVGEEVARNRCFV